MEYSTTRGMRFRPFSHALIVTRVRSSFIARASWVIPSWSRIFRNSRPVKPDEASTSRYPGQFAYLAGGITSGILRARSAYSSACFCERNHGW
jgi:hypothetical protein